MATPGGFEPPISTVTGWHVRPLHHGAIKKRNGFTLKHPTVLKKCIKGRIPCQGSMVL
jgi:hypothetical protein